MKPFRITRNLLTGLDIIDTQHKELARRVNRTLRAAAREGAEAPVLAETFAFLRDYVVSHFMVEEELMATHKYPQERTHRQAHIQRREWVQAMATSLANQEPQPELAMQIHYQLVEWLVQHIQVEDKRLTDFLRTKAQRDQNTSLLSQFKALFGR